MALLKGFNPHPAFRPGDAFLGADGVNSRELVSIRTRPFGRVMPLSFVSLTSAATVSIRTRPFGRVMRFRASAKPFHKNVSIRTRPFGRVMRAPRRRPASAYPFQSAPGLSAG